MSDLTLSEKIHIFIATGFYSGYSKYASGTIGTLAAIPFALLLNIYFSLVFNFIFILLLSLYSFFICWDVERIFKKHDPKQIVIDEWLGFFVAVYGQPVNFKIYFWAFVIFRFFDIFKPFPVNHFDKNVGNGIGVVLDDIVAGLYTYIIIVLVF